MSTVQIRVQGQIGGGLVASLSRGTANLPHATYIHPVTLVGLPPCDTEPNVRAYGEALFLALSAQPAIGHELNLLATTPPNGGDVLQFRLETPEAETIRWETLCAPQGRFLGINPGRQLNRQAAGSIWRAGLETRRYVGPLGFTAFLSAVGESAKAECLAICRQLEDAVAAGLDIAARIFVGEPDLLNLAAPANVQLLPLPASVHLLKAELKARPPQFLHFFCHGGQHLGDGSLDLASADDHDVHKRTGQGRSSIRLTVEELAATLTFQQATWLGVLNCCSGAAGSATLSSMAFRLADRAAAVAVGWSEPVTGIDATHFAQVFYQEVFATTRAALAGSNSAAVRIDLGGAILPVRQNFLQLYGAAPVDAFGRWTMPVLYENEHPLHVQKVQDPNMRERINHVAGALQALPPETPPEVRRRILAILDIAPAVPLHERPDLNGRIPQPPAPQPAPATS